jgi:hypothetical protein
MRVILCLRSLVFCSVAESLSAAGGAGGAVVRQIAENIKCTIYIIHFTLYIKYTLYVMESLSAAGGAGGAVVQLLHRAHGQQ